MHAAATCMYVCMNMHMYVCMYVCICDWVDPMTREIGHARGGDLYVCMYECVHMYVCMRD